MYVISLFSRRPGVVDLVDERDVIGMPRELVRDAMAEILAAQEDVNAVEHAALLEPGISDFYRLVDLVHWLAEKSLDEQIGVPFNLVRFIRSPKERAVEWAREYAMHRLNNPPRKRSW